MKLVYLAFALICIQGTSAADDPTPALNMIRRDPMITIADEGSARYDWHPPTPAVDNQGRTSMHHWNDHRHHRDHHWDPDHHLNDIWVAPSNAPDWWQPFTTIPVTVQKWLEQGRDVYWYHADNGGKGPEFEFDLKPTRKKFDYWCTFESGEGSGGSEEMIGSQTNQTCARACAERWKRDHSINGVTVLKNGMGGCWCKKNITGISGNSTAKKTCLLDAYETREDGWLLQSKWFHLTTTYEPHWLETTTMTHTAPTQVPTNDYSYMNYKNRQCRDTRWYAKGCFKTRRAFKRGKLLIYWRHDIEWAADRISSFASSLTCACAEAAREQGIYFFGLHFWGECWALDIKDVVADPEGDCTLADGTYKNKCIGHFNKDWGHTCLGGSRSYFLHATWDF